jgi:N-carbamoylputrescine amidase
LIVVPAAIGDLTDRDGMDVSDEPWTAVQRGHAIANAVFLRRGQSGRSRTRPRRWRRRLLGSSFVFDPYGVPLGSTSRDEEETLLVEIDLYAVAEARRRAAYFFRDRRIDAYEGLGRRSIEGFGA